MTQRDTASKRQTGAVRAPGGSLRRWSAAIQTLTNPAAWPSVCMVLRKVTMTIYVMINAYCKELAFEIQEDKAQDWTRVVDTDLDRPNDFADRPHLFPILSTSWVCAPTAVLPRANPRTDKLP